ncbi:hypothetical protein ONZ43_g1975 [Nemania bipapillata]|uniref:Uncharacterized protein n=1 Tax=Nemania bipapillata TaxID=110536 RepID=A0ACC2J345_9PEZI|nr:hypothetical protein ONZ43_g1975 [Nemania bipapillata]
MADFDLGSSFIPALHKPAALLPITKHHDNLLYLIETFPVTIVVGQTGSGKTTQIPQFLEHAGWVAEEYGCELGKQVGYTIRFEDVTSAATRIKFLTDGLLIREALVDPLLSRYSVIMVDEAHERSISTDILLGLLKKIRRRRPELRIIISSATLQAEEFLNFFSESSESQDTVVDKADEVESPAEDYVEKAVSTVFDIHNTEPDGDILVFLTGREEIDTAVQTIAERSIDLPPGAQSLLPLPLYAGLTTEQQMYVFDAPPENTRKVILSTNIAEASVTIDGIVYVIDSGFVKLRAFDPRTGIESLTITPVSKASAAQRAGRAGRTKPGKCFRLFTEDAYQYLPDTNPPEIQRSNLAPFILQLKALGIDNVVRFDYLTPPPAELMIKATELLYSLGALDEYAKLTRPLGMRMAELAVEPMMAKTLLSAPFFNCINEVLTIAAMTSLGGTVWVQQDGGKKQMESARRKFAAEEGDHLSLLNVYQAFVTKGKRESRFCHDNYLNFKALTRAVSIRGQLQRYLERFGISATLPMLRKCNPMGATEVLKGGKFFTLILAL